MRAGETSRVVWNRSLRPFTRRNLIRRYGEGPFRVKCTIKQKQSNRKRHCVNPSRILVTLILPYALKGDHLRNSFPSTYFSFVLEKY